MASQSIKVDPGTLDAKASKIRSLKDVFQTQFTQLKAKVDSLQAGGGWRGEDAKMYADKTAELQKEYTILMQVMEDHCKFLNDSANIYRQLQADTKAAAAKLHN